MQLGDPSPQQQGIEPNREQNQSVRKDCARWEEGMAAFLSATDDAINRFFQARTGLLNITRFEETTVTKRKRRKDAVEPAQRESTPAQRQRS